MFKPCFTISSVCLALIFAGCETVKTEHSAKKSAPEKIAQAQMEKTVENPQKAVYPPEPKMALSENCGKCSLEKSPREPDLKDAPAPKNLNALIPPGEDASRFLSPDSFVEKWKILGPFKFSLEDVKTVNEAIHKEFIPSEHDLAGNVLSPNDTVWKYYEFKNEKPVGIVDLNRVFPDSGNNVAAYAVAVLESPKEFSNLILYTGGSDFIKVWINGTLVHAYNKEPRKGDIDQDSVKGIKLEKGLNNVVVKVVKVSGEWSFFFRFATENNIPVRVKK